MRIIDCEGYKLSDYKTLCKRGVIWLGQTCNLRCYFCYFTDKISSSCHPEHDFMPLEKAKKICKTLVEVYGNNAVDIQGGEPTLYPHLCDLLEYANGIGLKPTLITNAVALSDKEKCRNLKNADIFDLLISIHALGETYDKIVRVPGASERQMKGIDHCVETGIPFRINITLTQEALSQLDSILRLSVSKKARAVNFIAFNPFVDQSQPEARNREAIPLYTEIARILMPALDFLEENKIEANVRYLPFCVFPEKYRKFVQNFQQITYDLHEWEAAGEIWCGAPSQRQAKMDLSEPIDFLEHLLRLRQAYLSKETPHFKERMQEKIKGMLRHCPPAYRFASNASHWLQPGKKSNTRYPKSFYLQELGEVEGFSDLEYAYKEFRALVPRMMHPYAKCEVCDTCDATGICDGFHRDYSLSIGFREANPIHLDSRIYDPRHYMKEQMKVIEEKETELWKILDPAPEAGGEK